MSFVDCTLNYPLPVYAAVFCIYVSVTGLSLPGATPMSLIVGWYFGFVRGVILVSFASTLGATIAFLLSRHLFRGHHPVPLQSPPSGVQ